MRRIKAILILLFLTSSFSFASTNSIDLLKDAKQSGIVVYWDSLSQTGILEKNGRQLSFRPGQNFVLQNSTKVSFTDSPVIEDGRIKVSKNFFADAQEFFNVEQNKSDLKIGAILIDAGHGGKDPGAMMEHVIGGKKVMVREKDVALKVALMLSNMLSTAYPDKKIILTRSSDVFISLQERTEIANGVKLKENEAVLYISVHMNSSLDKKAKGYEVWYLTPGHRRTVLDSSKVDDPKLFNILNSMMEEEYTTESILIAKFIMDGLNAQIGSKTVSRGIKAEEWFVVKNSKMPSVLIELGFVSNPAEAALLNDKAYLQKSALGIYNGITAFVSHFERSRGFTGNN
ncbi:MAG: N-acetylmuramoyl-L-alanine amidase [Treponema sp.]|nr:N-acetylmuramoyl-L-alanine amidase [Treponema sp.]